MITVLLIWAIQHGFSGFCPFFTEFICFRLFLTINLIYMYLGLCCLLCATVSVDFYSNFFDSCKKRILSNKTATLIYSIRSIMNMNPSPFKNYKQLLTVGFISLAAFSTSQAQTITNLFELETSIGVHKSFSVVDVNEQALDIVIKDSVRHGSNHIEYYGELDESSQTLVTLEFKDKDFSGEIINRNTQVTSTLSLTLAGQFTIHSESLNEDQCDVPIESETSSTPHSSIYPMYPLVSPPSPTLTLPIAPSGFMELESKSDAPGVVLLDVDGHTLNEPWWTGQFGVQNMPAVNLSDNERYAIYLTIKEDFAPINVNVTLSESVFNSYPSDMRTRVIVSNESFTPSTTGYARIGGFDNQTSSVCFINGFSNNNLAYKVAEVCSHEVGHSLGLRHDGAVGANATDYYRGHGTGTILSRLWGPLMGSTYSTDVSHFSNGDYLNPNNTEDDFTIMTSATYNLGYRTDLAGSEVGTAANLEVEADGSVLPSKNEGVIELRSDVDVFSFVTSGGNVDLTVASAAYKPNLDIEVQLLDDSGNILLTSDPAGISDATISTNLTAGTYNLRIDGVGYLSASNGYSDYGSRGYYYISGTIANDGSVSSLAQSSSVIVSSSSIETSSSSTNSNSCDTVPRCVEDISGNWNGGDQCQFENQIWEANYWTLNNPTTEPSAWTFIEDCQIVLSSSADLSSETTVEIQELQVVELKFEIQDQGIMVDSPDIQTIRVFNSVGQEIQTLSVNQPGFYAWGSQVNSGVYHLQILGSGNSIAQTMRLP